MTIHPVHSSILLPLLHLLDNHSINTSICAPIQQFIYPSIYSPHHSSICLSSIHPSIHPNTHGLLPSVPGSSIKTTPQLFKVSHVNTIGRMLAFQTDKQKTEELLESIVGANCNHSCDCDSSGKMQNTTTRGNN